MSYPYVAWPPVGFTVLAGPTTGKSMLAKKLRLLGFRCIDSDEVLSFAPGYSDAKRRAQRDSRLMMRFTDLSEEQFVGYVSLMFRHASDAPLGPLRPVLFTNLWGPVLLEGLAGLYKHRGRIDIVPENLGLTAVLDGRLIWEERTFRWSGAEMAVMHAKRSEGVPAGYKSLAGYAMMADRWCDAVYRQWVGRNASGRLASVRWLVPPMTRESLVADGFECLEPSDDPKDARFPLWRRRVTGHVGEQGFHEFYFSRELPERMYSHLLRVLPRNLLFNMSLAKLRDVTPDIVNYVRRTSGEIPESAVHLDRFPFRHASDAVDAMLPSVFSGGALTADASDSEADSG